MLVNTTCLENDALLIPEILGSIARQYYKGYTNGFWPGRTSIDTQISLVIRTSSRRTIGYAPSSFYAYSAGNFLREVTPLRSYKPEDLLC